MNGEIIGYLLVATIAAYLVVGIGISLVIVGAWSLLKAGSKKAPKP